MAEQSGLEYRLTELRKYLDEFQSRVDQLLDAWRRVAEMRHTLGSSSFFEDILARVEGELRTPWSPRSTDEVTVVDSEPAPSPRATRGEAAARKPAGKATRTARAAGTAPRTGSRGRRPAGGREPGGAGVPSAADGVQDASSDTSSAGTTGAGATGTRKGRGTGRSGTTGTGTRPRAGRAAKAADGTSTVPSQRRRRAAVAAEGAATSERASSRGDQARGGRRTTRTAVLEAAAAVGGEFGVSDLVERMRESGMTASETAIRRVVLRMADAGQLARVGRGRYRLP
jgi:hypothetical protein